MRSFTLVVLFALVSNTLLAQNSDLKQAIKHYNARNLALAEREIDRAVKANIRSEQDLSQAMFYYFVIKADIYCTIDLLQKNMDILDPMKEAYTIHVTNDQAGNYEDLLKAKARYIIALLYEISLQQYQNSEFLDYFHTMEHYADFNGLINEHVGPMFAILAEEAYEHDELILGIKYNFRMIDLGFQVERAYMQSLDAIYKLGDMRKVDQVLAQAKQAFPTSDAFAKTEILRLIDKDMKFTAGQYADKVLTQAPNNVEILYLNGKVNDLLNEHKKALAYYKRVLKVDSSHFDTNLALGLYYFKFSNKSGHLKKAKQYLEIANKLRPGNKVAEEYLTEVLTLLPDGTNLVTDN